jgi:hypothetical protein
MNAILPLAFAVVASVAIDSCDPRPGRGPPKPTVLAVTAPSMQGGGHARRAEQLVERVVLMLRRQQVHRCTG